MVDVCVVEHGPCVVHGQCMDARGGKTKFHMEGNGRQLVLRVLEAVSMKLSNTRVRWFSDHQNVVRILHVGSKKAELKEVAWEVFSLSVPSLVKIEVEWIPRELNLRADLLSRIIDLDDWMLNPAAFAELDKAWGQICQFP